MFAEYIQAALERAVYKTLEGEEDPIFVSVPELPRCMGYRQDR
ncbi:MAG TPA: hypothetical protein VLB04_08880 [Methanotrichaceae archaeon]|nr:hypothetical protein [Methanotrichaceae archaeon]